MKLPRGSKDRKTNSLDTDQLPIDLMMDIFSTLSLKTIAICRCVSKQWASVLGRCDFRDLLLTRSHARPRSLLFACTQDNKVSFLSSPQPQGPDDEMSSSSDHHISFSFDHPVKDISTSVSGLVCVHIRGHRFENGREFMVEESVICNPSTGQSLTIPRMNTEKMTHTVRFFGYDPVEKLHKVLGIIRDTTMEHQVLTLGGGREKVAWKTTERGIPCGVTCGERRNICINGVFYYVEFARDEGYGERIICFDVRSDRYSFVNFPERIFFPELLDCNGKLGSVASVVLGSGSKDIEIWVLQDPERHEWSRRVYVFPPMWNDVVDPVEMLEIVGGTGPNEYVMSPIYSSDPFHVYYCNFEKETVTRVVIQGMGAFGSARRYAVDTFVNHVEDVKLMEL